MTDAQHTKALAEALTLRLHRDIPMAAYMTLAVHHASTDAVILGAAFAPNRNLHGSVFAGSQFSLATLAGWSLVTLLADSELLAADVVMQHADIRYLLPLHGDPGAVARWRGDSDLARALKMFRLKGRARLAVAVDLLDANGQICATLEGEYVLSRAVGS